ncbi:MAG TPA: hypothetical protein DDW76_04675 [Cyanobacteria bacterium UBA11369]|nr:hypothetical protein [Cyanobacteria bacterium UBA11371]HBE18346.1 hypothetical protein [Cyanobacteria bacterium UBA11367]HBE35586.1 hypothetical protein [Cyanobacteria bacterium UBA11368]HBE48101.1 hypothetical protein [Cyanobacteria bacterium UBA11369]
MILNLNELMAIYPEQIWIDISPQEREKAWQQTQNQPYSNAGSRWNAYLNCLCLNTFTRWVKEEPELEETLKIWPNDASLPSFWDVVNGTKLTLGETGLVLIPSDKSAFSEFRIPQEWVDIANWAARYYLAVNLNLDAGWMRVRGYASHEQIQQEGRCDRLDRTYVLDPEDLIADINVMWVARELFPANKLAVKALPTLSREQTEKILQQLSHQIDYSPRLDLSFEQWASIVANDETRQQLYQLRLANQNIAPSQPKANNLSLWFQNIFDAGWQSVETILGTQRETLAFQFRTDAALNDVSVKGLKLIDLGIDIKGNAVMLLVGLTPEIDQKVNIRVQLYPAKGETYLPPNLKLGLLSQSGVTLQEVESRSQDNYIQLKRFKSPAGKGFTIQVALGDVSIKEDFVLSSLVS